MRIYLKDESEEKVFDVLKNGKDVFQVHGLSNEIIEINYRMIAGKFFYSLDGLNWKKSISLMSKKKITHLSNSYDVYQGFRPSSQNNSNAGSLMTQMPGKIIKIMVHEGQEVKKGDKLVVLEAMKMENEIKCQKDGKIAQINVQEGQTVDSGHLLLSII